MKLSRLFVSLLFTFTLPAQTLYNLTVPAGGTTVIDWNGRPALCIVSNYTLATFWSPIFYPPSQPKVELQVQALGVWDFHPCAVGSRWELLSNDVTYRPYSIPPGGLFMGVPFGRTLRFEPFDGALSSWQVSYCPANGPCGTCPGSRNPEGACLVAYLVLK